MHSQITIIGEMGLIDLSGIVDDTDAGRLHDWIVDLRLQGTERVVVDLTELTWVRRSARASLIEIAELLEAEGGPKMERSMSEEVCKPHYAVKSQSLRAATVL